MSELRRPGATLHYADAGPREAPIIVLGHGLLFSSQIFHHQVDALSDRYRCITVDWRGHGLTRARGPFPFSALSDDLLALLLHVGRPVHYVGHSMGAYLAIPVAADHPSLFRSLTLVSASASAEEPATAYRYHRMATVYRHTGRALLRQRTMQIMFSPESLRSPRIEREIKRWTEELAYPPRAELRDAIRAVANRRGIQCETAALTVPTQIIAGEEDAANPLRRSLRLKELQPKAPLHILPGVGHVPPLEAPREVTRHIDNFAWQTDHQARAREMSASLPQRLERFIPSPQRTAARQAVPR